LRRDCDGPSRQYRDANGEIGHHLRIEMDRPEIVHQNFLRRVAAGDLPASTGNAEPADAGLTADELVDLFRAQVSSRHLDRAARKLRARNEGYYTIGSSGHEGMAAVAAAFRPTDMALLHYRDAAFQLARAQQVAAENALLDLLLGFVASADDPISGGRHKVLGSKSMLIPPQTSTIASHLPKAVGIAYSIGLAKRHAPEHRVLADDGVVICSFGDASVNHSSAQGAFNTAGWTSYQGIPLPLVFVCEDNGLGISVTTPTGWVEATLSGRPGIDYVRCDGLDIVDTYSAAKEVSDRVRRTRRPAILHMSCVRLFGHAGADAPSAYLTSERIEADEANDPLLHSARIVIEHAGLNAAEVLDVYRDLEMLVDRTAEEATGHPRLESADEVMASLVPPRRPSGAAVRPSSDLRLQTFGAADLTAMERPQHLARLINWALTDLMLEHSEIVIAGQDVGVKGGVYGVTQRLHQRFGPSRVIDTLLDEQSILGLAIGLAHNGFVPIPEIQFLAYLHNAEDQLRGEAATLPFFSDGNFTNPMVVRVPGLGYQRGFGGHFHNDNSLAVLRDIPGLVIACPSSGSDAVGMLRECVRLAREEQRVIVFVEPIALYMVRDLHEPDDDLWTHPYLPADAGGGIALGSIGVQGEGTDLAIVTYGNGHYLSQQAARVLRDDHGLASRIIDLRWLAPLSTDQIVAATNPCAGVLIVDECRSTGSQSEALMAMFAERTSKRPARLCALDSFIATGPAFAATLPSRDAIVGAALELTGSSDRPTRSP
jgi:2-oxoisovalerate dehydrogenase E1 component